MGQEKILKEDRELEASAVLCTAGFSSEEHTGTEFFVHTGGCPTRLGSVSLPKLLL